MHRLVKFGAWVKRYFTGWRITRVDAVVFLILMLAGVFIADNELRRSITVGEKLLGQVHRVHAEEAVYFKGRVYLDFNLVNEDTLASLPYIGDGLAARIVAYRKKYGPFSSMEEVDKIYGIGEKRLEAIQDYMFIR